MTSGPSKLQVFRGQKPRRVVSNVQVTGALLGRATGPTLRDPVGHLGTRGPGDWNAQETWISHTLW